MQQYVCIDFENIFDYSKSFESDRDMKNMFCSNFHFKLKRNLDDKSDEEIDDIDDLFCSTYNKPKSDEEEDNASTIVDVTANITSVISRTKQRAPVQPNLIRKKEWWDRCYRSSTSEEFKKQVRIQRGTFDTIKETNLNLHPISVNRQLGLTLYRLGHGASCATLSQLFGVSISLASVTLTKVAVFLSQRFTTDL